MANFENIDFNSFINVLDKKEFKVFFNEVSSIIVELQKKPIPKKKLTVIELMDKYNLKPQIPDELFTQLEPQFKSNIYAPSHLAAKGCRVCLSCLICLICADINAASGLASLVGLLQMAPDK